MKKLATLCLLFAALAGAGCTGKTEKKSASKGPVPMTHILICCRSSNEGVIRFKVGDEWITNHDYRNIDHARAILSTIQQAGINDVIIDLTNPSQWPRLRPAGPAASRARMRCGRPRPKIRSRRSSRSARSWACVSSCLSGNPAAHTLAYWNGIAERIWKSWAQKDVYRKYGYGDDRPMLVVFYMGEDFLENVRCCAGAREELPGKFRIGTCQVNSPMNFTATDGWGYRNRSSSSDNKVRFVCPNEGVVPTAVETQYVAGVGGKGRVGRRGDRILHFRVVRRHRDAIFWGIADTRESRNAYKRYPGDESPDAYYNVVKDYLSDRAK